MRKIREVLRLRLQCGLSKREIAASCKIGLGTVYEYVRRARDAGLSWPLPEEFDDTELERRLFPPPPKGVGPRPLPDWPTLGRELRRKGVTLLLLWYEYRAAHPDGYGYSRFCELYNQWAGTVDPRMRQVHKAGEKLFVDYAGLTVPIIDPRTGAAHAAQIFVATLGASSHTFAEATASQALPDWIGSHVRAFAFFGGVPAIVVPDNLKAGVTSACFYEPEINPTYQELARHYGVAVLPARVRTPRDKAKVENGVQQVERWVLAPLRNRRFFALAELNEAMLPLLHQLNARPGPGLPAPRLELFASLDEPALGPLPVNPYELALWKKARVHLDYHVQADGHFYSVGHRLIRQEVEVRLTRQTVEVFQQGQRVASHVRSFRKGGFTTLPEHMPQNHREWGEWNPERLTRWAEKTGPATAQLVEGILASRPHPSQGYRSCLGILRLGNEYGFNRLEAACARALAARALTYRSVKSILIHRLDAAAPTTAAAAGGAPSGPPGEASVSPLQHANLRGAEYYQPAPATTSNASNERNRDAAPPNA
jgi:transposase